MAAQMLGKSPPMAALEAPAALAIRTLRVWAGLRMARRCPLDMAVGRLGSREAAATFQRLIAVVSAAWPDPVALAPPCCPLLSHDEATLAALLVAAAAADRPGFDREAQEMLGQDARDRLWAEMRAPNAAVGV